MTIRDGKVDIGHGLIVGPGFTESEFLGSPSGMAANVLIKNGVHHSYKLQNTEVVGKNFVPLLYFSTGVLTQIQLHPVAEVNESWSAYSPSSETAKKFANDSWLTKTLGEAPPYSFDWGMIESVFDANGGMTFVIFRYLKI